MPDFPKTIYVEEVLLTGILGSKDEEDVAKYRDYAIYELKEVKKKVTNVELIDLDK